MNKILYQIKSRLDKNNEKKKLKKYHSQSKSTQLVIMNSKTKSFTKHKVEKLEQEKLYQ